MKVKIRKQVLSAFPEGKQVCWEWGTGTERDVTERLRGSLFYPQFPVLQTDKLPQRDH